ncbi:hypothetical protein LRS71_24655 [Rhodococcus pyridinivorans]|uniref:hypothetical protein n=1 Tax=Rhodococcus pyridinivorans TaxID=103816 RepID=UPI001E37F2DC|nr:hypothetical protein [Rhodococcus pyridinivorans]MCD5422704.1 hypothetical protein [Rhodococcus pyridinivorans]
MAVARDLRCLRYGSDVQPDRLVWAPSVGPEYAVTIGWNGTVGISGFALKMNASFCESAVWVADTQVIETKLSPLGEPSYSHLCVLDILVGLGATDANTADDIVIDSQWEASCKRRHRLVHLSVDQSDEFRMVVS